MNSNPNPFENDNTNEEFSNPFHADESNNDNENSNNNSNNFNPFENSNNNINPYDNNNNFNPYDDKNNNNKNNFNPYDDDNSNNNDNDNPFENNNKNNPFENNFEENNFNNNDNNNNNNQGLPSFQNFQDNLNPYQNNNNNNFYNNNNFNNNNQGNNYYNNFGGPSDELNNVHPNPFDNPQNFNNPNMNNNQVSNADDAKKIKSIMNMCESLYNQSFQQYDNYNIKEAMRTLCKSIKGLDSLKQTILNKKTSFNALLPKITSLRNKAFKSLQEYRINIYRIINLKFRPVPYNDTQPLVEFSKRYLLTEPFISFDDIFDPAMDQNKKLKFVMNDYFKKSQRMGYKNLLLYGPKGSGKTLAVHALANDLKGKVAQIQGTELFKIPYFSKEFIKAAFGYMQFKPLIVYIKNMEEMLSSMNNFNFLYDRTSSSTLQNVIFIASTTVPVQMLPKEVSKKFHYIHCIRPAEKNQKYNYIKFISEKIGIKINMIQQDLNSFVFQNLYNYSNEDIFNLLTTAIEMKQKEIGEDEENMVYKEGLNENDIKRALKSVQGSMTPDVLKNYYL